MSSILKKLKHSDLCGRGGACFPTALKWEMVKKAPGKVKYVVCNASEGEPGVQKDKYILENYADQVIEGMKIAIKFLDAKEGFIYLNPGYYQCLHSHLEDIIADLPIKVIAKAEEAGYIGGEETAVLNALEKRRIEPRLKPPFPTTNGLWGAPTLINNVETFYDIALIESGEYKEERFYTISGDCLWDGVYRLPESYTIRRILEETDNYPDFLFCVQVGGAASGEMLNISQLNQEVAGSGAIVIYSLKRHHPIGLMRRWVDFFVRESCGQCTPCREGIFRLYQILYSQEVDWVTMALILENLAQASFCGLGCGAAVPFSSLIYNILPFSPEWQKKIGLDNFKKICQSFKI
ncbi:hypothetical protein D6821_00530 [Candidatus Parcubacteria bacterium]|nr:MAG: hypothetical protein D6821_00530 [Candidatus Parcubacteria bacterium]